MMRPSKWDWRKATIGNWDTPQDWTTPVKDQGDCGSCPAFACIGAIESWIKILSNDPNRNPNLSEAHLFFYNDNKCKGDDSGWNVPDALNYLKEGGVPDEACYPYHDYDQECLTCKDWQKRATKITGWMRIPNQMTESMKEAISSFGPLIASMVVYEDFHDFYNGGIYEHLGELGYEEGSWAVKKVLEKFKHDFPPNTPFGVVSSNPGWIDLFAVDTNGYVQNAWFHGSAWQGWSTIGTKNFTPNVPISAISNSPGCIDLFAIGDDKYVYTAWFHDNVWGEDWKKVTPDLTPDKKFIELTRVAAVSDNPGWIDLFAIDEYGDVYTAWFHGDTWHGWSQVKGELNQKFNPSVSISVVSNNPGCIDIFALDISGNVHTAWFHDNAWGGWRKIGSGLPQFADKKFPSTTPITAISANLGCIDLFAVDEKGDVYTAWFHGDTWHGWSRIQDPSCPPHIFPTQIAIFAISDNPGWIDIFAIDKLGDVYTACFHNGSWHGWNQVQGIRFRAYTPIAVVSAYNGWIDLFAVDPTDLQVQSAWFHSYYYANKKTGGHDVVVVGYDDDDQCWICKNSWGSSKPGSGYFRIKYGECEIDDEMFLIKGISPIWLGWSQVFQTHNNNYFPPFTHVIAISSNPGCIDLFAITDNAPTSKYGHVYTAWFHDNVWGPNWADIKPESLIGTKAFTKDTRLAGVSSNPGWIDLFAIGEDGYVYTTWFHGDNWHDWTQIKGRQDQKFPSNAPISVVSNNPGWIDLFAIGEDGYIHTAWFHDNVWGGWENVLPESTPNSKFVKLTRVAALSANPKWIDLFANNEEGKMYTAWFHGDTWHGWNQVGHLIINPKAPISVVSNNPGWIDLFIHGKLNSETLIGDLNNMCFHGNGWESWKPVGFWINQRDLAVISAVPGSMDLFAISDPTKSVMTKSFHENTWVGPVKIIHDSTSLKTLFPLRGPIAAVSSKPGCIDLFIVGSDGRVYTAWFH
jgi:hypothetical protein